MRLNRLLSAFVVCLMVIVEIAFVYSSVLAGPSSISPTTQAVGVTTTTSMPDEGHTLQGGFWRVDGGFVSTIRIKNILVIAPIQVTPTLYMADGTAYPLVSVMVPVSGVATVNINDALKRAPQAIAAHISEFGSLMLVYKYPTPGHVVATLAAIDVPRSLSFVYMINEAMVMPDDNALKVSEGLWWRQDRGVHGTLSLSNTTDQPRTATLRVNRQPGDVDSRDVNLLPFTTQVIALEQFSREASDEKNAAGGVRVEYNGPSGAIMVTGSLANESEGYSANMPFWAQGAQTSPVRKINFGSAGIMVGKPDPMMMPGFSTETRFTPYLALRNTTNAPMDVALLLNYMTGATPVNRSLTTQRLRAFESRTVNLSSMLDETGMKLFNGSINLGFSYTGQGGDLIVATGSVDQTGSYVFEVRPQGIGQSIGRISGYWSVDNGNDAMFSAWNPTDEPEDIMATLYYGDGSGTYHLPIHLAPQASASVDVAMLVRDKMPDIDGKIIPSNIRDGSASFDTAEKNPAAYDGRKLVTAVISGAVFNIADATCGMVCTYCNGYNNWVIVPDPINDAIGTSSTNIAQATDSYGNKQTMSGGSWSSSNTGIMTASNGITQGISVGQATITDFFNSVIAIQGQFCVNESMPDNCPQGSAGPSGPGNGTPPTATITIRFANPRASSLNFPSTCSQSLGVFPCPTYWGYNVEVQAVVSDDASKWTMSQTEESSRSKGTYTDSTGIQHAFNVTESKACPPCDGPLSGNFQQTAGQKNIFYIDVPTINKTFLPGETVFTATRIANFTAHFCSTVVPTACYTQPYFIKIVVNGTILDTTNSTAGLGTMSTVF